MVLVTQHVVNACQRKLNWHGTVYPTVATGQAQR